MMCKNLISYKKKTFFENILNDSIYKSRELWKALKSLDLPSKTSVFGTNALKVNNTMSSETKQYWTSLKISILL